MIAVQRRSNLRHLVHPDGLATYCGRILHRTKWRIEHEGGCECRRCVELAPSVIASFLDRRER